MAVFYGTKITSHITSLTDGGYLLCSSVPIARTGSQLYLPSEIECEGNEKTTKKLTGTQVRKHTCKAFGMYCGKNALFYIFYFHHNLAMFEGFQEVTSF